MDTPSLVLLSNQQALERFMDIVASNLANASTTGFKREGIQFDTYLSHKGEAADKGIEFVVDRATYRDNGAGPMLTTGNPLDVAIEGQGYFPVKTPAGIRYTRGGSFQVDNQGQIVTTAGYPVLGDGNQPIIVPDTATDIAVAGDGVVSVRVDNGPDMAQVGQFKLMKFDNEQALQAAGGGIYSTGEPPKPAEDSTIVQGMLEQSNVQPVTEITQMIEIMRTYEQNMNLIGQESSRLNDAITKLSKVS